MNQDAAIKSAPLIVKRNNHKLERDITRVICRVHIPGGDPARVKSLIQRILRLDEQQTQTLLDRTLEDFSERHKDIRDIFERHFEQVLPFMESNNGELSVDQKLLIGAYFTMEYAIESAALFNPSIVPHPDQSGLPDGSLRFVMSLRAVGEGHISSMVFRKGIIDRKGDLQFEPLTDFVDTPRVELHPDYDRHLFRLKLLEMGSCNEVTNHVLEQLPEHFSYEQLEKQIARLSENPQFPNDRQLNCFNNMHRLANSNYQLDFRQDHKLSERVIFPVSEEERGGIEDARFVQFYGDNGDSMYYATYTAYNGKTIMPQLIETRDFKHFEISTLNGKAIKNKGMALFPRKINGRYAMLSRQDGQNNYIMFSDHLHFWQEYERIQEPNEPWEFIQLGNCGSPMETEQGWLVLTHGVGPVRTYSISAILLDLDDPTQMIARLEQPLLHPQEEEREGYVPNVVYTCGALLHQDRLIIPYAMSDIKSGIASVKVEELIDAMVPV